MDVQGSQGILCGSSHAVQAAQDKTGTFARIEYLRCWYATKESHPRPKSGRIRSYTEEGCTRGCRCASKDPTNPYNPSATHALHVHYATTTPDKTTTQFAWSQTDRGTSRRGRACTARRDIESDRDRSKPRQQYENSTTNRAIQSATHAPSRTLCHNDTRQTTTQFAWSQTDRGTSKRGRACTARRDIESNRDRSKPRQQYKNSTSF